MKSWHLFLLSSFAIVQPLLEVLGNSPQFFVIRRSEPIDIFFLVLFLMLAPPFILALVHWAAERISESIGRIVFTIELTTVVTCIFLPISKRLLMLPGFALVPICLAAGIIISLAYFKTRWLPSFITFLSPAFLIFPCIFLVSAPIRSILSSDNQAAAIGLGASKKADLVMLIFDELPLVSLLNEKKEIDAERFPGFAALAKNATWFRNASSLSAWTEHAVPIILSGRKPASTKEVPSYKDYPKNIFTLLGASHHLNVYEQVTHLCPETICQSNIHDEAFLTRISSLLADIKIVYLHLLLPDDLKSNLPDISFAWGEFGESPKQDKKFQANRKGLLDKGDWADDEWLFNKFLASIKKSEKPAFNFLHITFPHVPYRYYPSGKKYLKNLNKRNDKGYRKQWGPEDWPTVQHYQRYFLQLGFADRMLSRLIERLKDLDIYDSSLLVVTADHGTSFMPLEFSRRVSPKNYVDVMSMPLFMKLPNQAAATISDRNVETIDILPTVSEILGIARDEQQEGASAFDLDKPERVDKTFFTLDIGSSEILHFPAHFDFSIALERKQKLFGQGSSENWQYKVGPFRELLGVSQKSLNNLVPATVRLDDQENFQNVNPSSNYVPGYIAGALLEVPEQTHPLSLAISVNGIIQATTETFIDDKNAVRFISIVPENSFKKGKNDIAVLLIH